MVETQCATIMYTSPTGRVWQLQGRNQNEHPVTLLNHFTGIFGAPLSISSQSFIGVRGALRKTVVVDQAVIELKVRVEAQKNRSLEDTISAFLNDFPEDTTSLGMLSVSAGSHSFRHLRVFRSEPVEMLAVKDPILLKHVEFLLVLTAEDPYPFGNPHTVSATLSANQKVTLTLENIGEVDIPLKFRWVGEADEFTFWNPWGQPVTIHTAGFDTFVDCSPHKRTYTNTGGTWSIKHTWGTETGITISPGENPRVSFQSKRDGKVVVYMTPQYRRLYA